MIDLETCAFEKASLTDVRSGNAQNPNHTSKLENAQTKKALFAQKRRLIRLQNRIGVISLKDEAVRDQNSSKLRNIATSESCAAEPVTRLVAER